MRRSHPLCVFFRHHKCATGWIDGILREVCFYMGWRFRIVHRPADFAAHGSLGRLVEAERPEVLAFTNADAAHLDDLPPFRGFHVIRDPRDVVVSGYLSHRYSHPTQDWPELAEHRRRLQQVSPQEGLFLEMNFSREWLAHMREWDYTRPDVLELKMDVMNHYRKGQPGDWRNHFRPEHAAYFQQTFGDLLIQLEYETDARWLASSRPDTPEALDPSRDLLQAGPA